MLKCSTSLWSADLANLESDIKRVDPYSERYHLDVADGHQSPTLLFFPDLVAAMRPHTRKPFEVHLMTTDPLMWMDPFVEAGANGFIVFLDDLEDVSKGLKAIKSRGMFSGISLRLDEPVEALEPYWNDLDLVTLLGTEVGIKGAEMDPGIPDRILKTRRHIEQAGATTEIQMDGGIRRHTVPLMHEAGADWIVPGSLMFKEDPAEMRTWLAGLGASH
jgi:ribulose-phosphate 3-epimerase